MFPTYRQTGTDSVAARKNAYNKKFAMAFLGTLVGAIVLFAARAVFQSRRRRRLLPQQEQQPLDQPTAHPSPAQPIPALLAGVAPHWRRLPFLITWPPSPDDPQPAAQSKPVALPAGYGSPERTGPSAHAQRVASPQPAASPQPMPQSRYSSLQGPTAMQAEQQQRGQQHQEQGTWSGRDRAAVPYGTAGSSVGLDELGDGPWR